MNNQFINTMNIYKYTILYFMYFIYLYKYTVDVVHNIKYIEQG